MRKFLPGIPREICVSETRIPSKVSREIGKTRKVFLLQELDDTEDVEVVGCSHMKPETELTPALAKQYRFQRQAQNWGKQTKYFLR